MLHRKNKSYASLGEFIKKTWAKEDHAEFQQDLCNRIAELPEDSVLKKYIKMNRELDVTPQKEEE